MSGQILDSDRRCGKCGKRMLLEVGQHDSRGDLEVSHECWQCGTSVPDRAWTRPNKVARELVAARLMAQRLAGWTHEVYIDPSPFPVSEFDEEVADA